MGIKAFISNYKQAMQKRKITEKVYFLSATSIFPTTFMLYVLLYMNTESTFILVLIHLAGITGLLFGISAIRLAKDAWNYSKNRKDYFLFVENTFVIFECIGVFVYYIYYTLLKYNIIV